MNGLKLKTELAGLNCTASAFAALAVPPLTSRKLTQQTISAITANQKDFDSPAEAAEFFGVVEAMKFLQETVLPQVPINYSDLRVKDALVQVFEQRRNELDPMHRRCWFVRLSVHNFFKDLRSDGSVIETMTYYDSEAAAFTNYELASEIVKRLKQHDIGAKAEVLTCERRQSTITTSLEEIGFASKEGAQ
jgi:hypothetical protein